MRVFLAGATGALGRPLVQALLAAGHELTGTTRSPERAAELRAAGAQAAVLDALDADALRAALLAAEPEVVVDQLTALPPRYDVRRYARMTAATDRLRLEATPVLVAAAAEAGARRVVAQSVAFAARPAGPAVLDESAPLWTDAPEPHGRAVGATAALEAAVLGAAGSEGVVLRYGALYGPGTWYAGDGDIALQVRRRRFPIVGRGDGVFSFVAVEDAVSATVLALDRGAPGIYNVADEDPAPMREWLPIYARALGARPPRRVPLWLARLVVGSSVAGAMNALRGADSAKARRELGWAPAYPSWREGFPAMLA